MLGGLPGAIFIFRAVSDSQSSGAVLPVILTNRKSRAASDVFVLEINSLSIPYRENHDRCSTGRQSVRSVAMAT